jgi:O-antigen/teichoic acid export membrane protein
MVTTTLRERIRRYLPAGSLGARVTLTFAFNSLNAAIGIVTGVLAAHLLGPMGRGELAAIQSWAMLLASIGMLGVPEALIYSSSQNPQRVASYLGTSCSIVIVSSALFGCGGWLLMPRLLHAQSANTIEAGRWYLVLQLLIYAGMGMPHQALRAVGSWRAWNIFRVLPSLLWMICLVVGFFVPSLKSAPALASIFLCVQLLLVPASILLTKHYVPDRWTLDRTKIRPLLSYGASVAFTSIPQMINLRLDQLLIAMFLPPSLLGYYAIAVTWSGAAAPVLNAMPPVLLPHFSEMSTFAEKRQRVTQIIKILFPAGAVVSVLLLVATPFVIPALFGRTFAPAIHPALVLAIANTFNGINGALEAVLQGMGKPLLALRAEVIGMIGTIVLLWLLLPRIGIMGAAIASLVSYTTVTVSLLLSLRQHLTRVP